MPKVKKQTQARHDPLVREEEGDGDLSMRKKNLKNKIPSKKTADHDVHDDDEVVEEQIMDSKTSRRLFSMVKEQQLEEEEGSGSRKSRSSAKPKIAASRTVAFPPKKPNAYKAGSDSEQNDEDNDRDLAAVDDDNWNPMDDLDIDAADAVLIDKFLSKEPRKQVNLADLIMKEMHKTENVASASSSAMQPTTGREPPRQLDPKIIEVYSKVGILLSQYRSGKLPKAFKIIPTFPNWEEILYLTNPSEWTPHATYQVTRIFVSNLQAKMAQRFFSLFLLDRVRDEIAETKKLNYHHYMALKKALYKPQAFFKGFLLPLCESGTCTLREAAIIGSVLSKVSIPILDSAAALLKIAEMDYTGPNSLFIRILLDKKYALPYKVLDSLVFHFLRFTNDARQLPVLWHQSLLVFAQRYKTELASDQKEAILNLLKAHWHDMISSEIRRELVNSSSRGEKQDIDMMDAL